MSQRYQGGILGVGFNPLQAPNAPTIGTATAGNQNVSVAFTAPANVGGSAISSYRVLANPGGIGATTSSSPVTISGLTNDTTYTFSVAAVNSYGFSPYSGTVSGTPAAPLYVENVFSTWLYTGNGSTQTITNGINLSGSGGMVWMKTRGANGQSHNLYDTVRGATNIIYANFTNASFVNATGLTSFNSTGFSLGSSSQTNFNNDNMASWTFREAPKFFDVVTYAGNGANRNIAHNLGVAPGMILVKRTDAVADWQVYHRSLANTQYMVLNTQASLATGATRWNSTTPTATEFTVGTDATVNASGGTYVAYLYAHDTASDGIIQCGSYTGNGSATGPTVTLGWEPQWLLVKRATGGTSSWFLIDSMRGFTMSNDSLLYAESTAGEENGYNAVNPTATGFNVVINDPGFNTNGDTYIYMAIRRGPMQTPTLGTSVFAVEISNVTGSATSPEFVSNFPVDMYFLGNRTNSGGSGDKWYWMDRLRGNVSSNSTTTAAESAFSVAGFAFNTGVFNTAIVSDYYATMFRRAPGFFDEVCYAGLNSTQTLNHNLGVAPELIIVKNRTTGGTGWPVWTTPFSGTNDTMLLNTTAAKSGSGLFTTTPPTSTVFTVGVDSWINSSGNNYVAYLFASAPGVSKVGSYTGTGALQTINCAFTTGARFVLIKRTDSTGDWFVWDSARGITSGNDPYLLLNSTAAEVTGTNYVDTDTTGFKVTAAAPAGINASGGTYIFLAIS